MRKNSSKRRPRHYQVGKGRPPLATRWKRGQSGNLSGRPKGTGFRKSNTAGSANRRAASCER
jgi:hypothetical protein